MLKRFTEVWLHHKTTVLKVCLIRIEVETYKAHWLTMLKKQSRKILMNIHKNFFSKLKNAEGTLIT